MNENSADFFLTRKDEGQNNPTAANFLAAGHFTVDVYSGFLNPIMPFIAAKIGIGIAITTMLMSISYLLSSLMQPLFGFLSDKYKRRFFIIFGLILISVFNPLTGVATVPWMLGLFIVLGNLGNGFFHPQATGFSFLFSKGVESSRIGRFLTLGTLGFALGPFLASSIVNFFGLESLPYTSIFGVILALFFVKYVPKISHIKVEKETTKFYEAFQEVVRDKTTRILIGLSMIKSLVSIVYCLLLPFLWKQIGYGVFEIGTIISIYTMAGALATYISPRLEKIIGTKKVFILSLVLVAPITSVMFLTLHSIPLLSVSMFVLLGFVSFLSSTLNMVLAQRLHPKIKSMISGFIGGFSWGAVGVLLSFFGYIAQKIGIIWLLSGISIIPLIYSYTIFKISDTILVKGK